jgi:hypothetical protein
MANDEILNKAFKLLLKWKNTIDELKSGSYRPREPIFERRSSREREPRGMIEIEDKFSNLTHNNLLDPNRPFLIA